MHTSPCLSPGIFFSWRRQGPGEQVPLHQHISKPLLTSGLLTPDWSEQIIWPASTLGGMEFCSALGEATAKVGMLQRSGEL